MPEQDERDSAFLNGKRYPLLAPVQDSVITPFPQKVTIGDFTRDSEIMASTIAWSDFGGGLGVEHGDFPSDQNRFYFSTLDTRYPRHITLLPEVGTYSEDASSNPFSGSTTFMIQYGAYLYICFANKVYRTNSTATAPTLEYTAANSVVDGVVYKGKLYLAVTGGHTTVVYDGASWDDTTLAASSVAAELLGIWDNKLYAWNHDQSFVSFNGTSWSSLIAAADWQSELGTPKQLIVFFDTFAAPALMLVTDNGLWGFDATDGYFVSTPLVYPSHPKIGKACVWRGALYVPVGESCYKYQNSTITVMGPDKDEGLPSTYRGAINQIVPTHQFIYALVNAAVSDDPGGVDPTALTDWIWTGEPSEGGITLFARTVSNGLVLAGDGSSWHTLQPEPDAGSSIGYGAVANISSTYSFWYSVEGELRYLRLPWSVHNPLQDPFATFATSGSLTTPWFDNSWAELPKLALAVRLVASGVTSTETISVYAQYDNDTTWHYLGQMTSGAKKTLWINRDDVAGTVGQVFYRIRLRIDMARSASDDTLKPVLDSFTISYMRRPPALWGWQMNIDLGFKGSIYGRTARQMWRELRTLAKSSEVFVFEYQDRHTGEEAFAPVVISRMGNIGIPGSETGRCSMALVEAVAESDISNA